MTERTREDMTSQQMEVLAVGELVECLNPDCERRHGDRAICTHPCDAKVGDWVLVAHRSLLETDQDGIYVVSQDDILAILQP